MKKRMMAICCVAALLPAAGTNGDGILTRTEATVCLKACESDQRPVGRNELRVAADLSKREKTGRGLWIASTGHSLVAPALGPLEQVAKLAGYDGHLQVRQISGGASGSPRALWQQPDERQTVKRALATGKCDVLTMGSHLKGSSAEDFSRWIELAVEHNPDIRIYIMDAWPFLRELLWRKGKKANDADADLQNYEQRKNQFTGLIRDTAEELNKKYPGKVHVIPIGDAMFTLVRRQLTDDLPGVDAVYVPGNKGKDSGDRRVGLYRDSIHPTPPVAVLEGYVYYACLYKKNPATLPKGLYPDARLDRILRNVAWKTVLKHPLSGVKEK